MEGSSEGGDKRREVVTGLRSVLKDCRAGTVLMGLGARNRYRRQPDGGAVEFAEGEYETAS